MGGLAFGGCGVRRRLDSWTTWPPSHLFAPDTSATRTSSWFEERFRHQRWMPVQPLHLPTLAPEHSHPAAAWADLAAPCSAFRHMAGFRMHKRRRFFFLFRVSNEWVWGSLRKRHGMVGKKN